MNIPKIYSYTVDGIVDEDNDLITFGIPSLNRSLDCDFDLEGIAHQAALSFFLNHEDYQTIDKYPLTFRFAGGGMSRDTEMYLQFAPTFQTKEGKLKREESIEVKKKRVVARKVKLNALSKDV